MDKFTPELRIFGDGDQLVFAFDSAFEMDVMRAARSIKLPAEFKQLSFALDGFNDNSVSDDGDRRSVVGKINLIITDVNGDETTHELADCKFMLPAIGRKRGAVQFVPVSQVEYAVRQGVSDALGAAIVDFYSARYASGNIAQALMVPAENGASRLPEASPSRRRAANDEPKAFRRKMMLAIVGAPLLVLFVAWGGGKVFTPSSPIEDAVARAMVQDPASVAAQVELTKETLKQMGLDPGQSGDIGCLTPQ